MTEAKRRFGELVNRALYAGEEIVVESRGKPKARISGYDEQRQRRTKTEQLEHLDRMIEFSKRIEARTGSQPDSAEELRKLREERDEQLLGLR
jgi:prevent-host-death family protein